MTGLFEGIGQVGFGAIGAGAGGVVGGAVGGGGGVLAGGTAGSVVPVVGTAGGAVVGGAEGAWAGGALGAAAGGGLGWYAGGGLGRGLDWVFGTGDHKAIDKANQAKGLSQGNQSACGANCSAMTKKGKQGKQEQKEQQEGEGQDEDTVDKPPPGSKPIDETDWSGDHGTIKGAIGSGGLDKTRIAPNGDVYSQNPDGTWTNQGPASDYVGSGKPSGRFGKDRK